MAKAFKDTLVGRILRGIVSFCTIALPYIENIFDNTMVGNIIRTARNVYQDVVEQ